MSATTTPRRRAAAVVLVLLVLLLHTGVMSLLPDVRLDSGAADRMPRRMQVAYVRELQQQAPPPAAPVVVPKPAARRVTRKRAPKPAPAASAVESATAASAAETPSGPSPAELAASAAADELAAAEAAASATEAAAAETAALAAASAASATAATAAAAAASASAVAAAASAASAPQAFEWPASTRLTYRLTGNYRGEVLGGATVEWIRDGSHYQVNLDVYVGAQSTPLVGRRMTSTGLLTDHGLVPQRYDEETRALFRQLSRRTIVFEPDRVLLPNGKVGERLPGIQDAASQFVQLTWLFTTHPELLKIGQSVEMPLALPTKVDRWWYDVVGEETLRTPIGDVQAYHMKPRRAPKPGGDLVVDVWFAPTLEYLPVRLLVRQDASNYVDLLLDRAPEQATAPR